MKKIGIFILSTLCILLMLCGCSKAPSDVEGMAIINPLTECTAEEIVNALGLKEIKLDNIESTSKIDGEPVIYSFDTKIDNALYNVRIAKATNESDNDISGVYMDDSASCVVYDSADCDTAPTITVYTDNEYSKAFGNWNGYAFSVSVSKQVPSSEMQKTTTNLAQALISKGNIK